MSGASRPTGRGRRAAAAVRPARASDAPAVLALARRFATSFRVDERAFRRSYRALLAARDAHVLVAESSGAVVGYALGFDHLALFANGRVAWLEELMVDEAWRRRGIGGLLVRAIEAWARSRGCRLLGLATRRAADFYVAIGYEESAVYFRKRLAPGARGGQPSRAGGQPRRYSAEPRRAR
jgi:GNAT superfamily N-acetyltransferase